MFYPLIILTSLGLLFFIIFRSEKRGRSLSFDRLSWLKSADLSLKKSILGKTPAKEEGDSFFKPPPEDKKMEFFLRGERLFFEKKYLSAEKWFLEAVRLDPHDPKIYSRLGTIYLAIKNYKDAKEAFLNAIKLEADVPARHFNLALALHQLSDQEGALRAIEKALEFKNEDPKYLALKEEIEKALLKEEKTRQKRPRPNKKKS